MTPTDTQTTHSARPARPAPGCPECGKPIVQNGKGRARTFCDDKCKAAHSNRRAVRGKSLTALAMGWRRLRGTGAGKQMFADLCAMLDEFNTEDRVAGRMPADEYVRLLNQTGLSGGGSFRERRTHYLHCSERHQGCHGRVTAGVGANQTESGRRARNDGWEVEFDAAGYNVRRAVCPNCRDDNRFERQAAE